MKVKCFYLWGDSSFDTGLQACYLRAAVDAAMGAAAQAGQTATQLGGQAAGEGAMLNPFYAREMTAEHAYDPTQLNEMLTAAGAGSGAATGAEEAQLKREAATTGNAAGQTKALQEMARDRMKTAAGTSEGIAAKDVEGALQMRQAGAAGEQGLYGENLKGQLQAMGQEAQDINAATEASKTGWLQNAEGIVKTAADVAGANPWGMFGK